MSDAHAIRRYLRPKQASAYTGIPESTLAKRRLFGVPPAFSKVGVSVLYDIRDLDALMATSRRRSTSDPGRAT